MANFDRLPLKYSFVLRLLRRSYDLKQYVTSDTRRRLLIECMYDMSKHTLYKLLKDYSTDPFNERFDNPSSMHMPVFGKYVLKDNKNNVTIHINNYNGSRDKYDPKYIKCYAYMDHELTQDLLSDEERLYFLSIHEDVEEMKKHFDALEKFQRISNGHDKLKRLY